MLPIHDWKDDIRTTEVHGERQIQRRRVLNQFLKTNVLRGGGEVQHCETLIVGGGIAGLYLAKQLPNSLVLERRTKVGGKVRTTYDDPGKPLFDDGPWRIHHSHHRMLQLLQSLSIETTTNASSSSSVLPQASACKPGTVHVWLQCGVRRHCVGPSQERVHRVRWGAPRRVHCERVPRSAPQGWGLPVRQRRNANHCCQVDGAGRATGPNRVHGDRRKENDARYTIHYQTLDGSTGTFTASNVIVCAPQSTCTFHLFRHGWKINRPPFNRCH